MNESYDSTIADAAERYGVPFAWIKAIIATESSFRPEVVSGAGAIGLMQLEPYTARALGYTGQNDGLKDPYTNIDLGTKLLKELRGSYGENTARVYSAYNSGNPDFYLTNPAIASDVGKFQSYLAQIEAGITYVAGEPENGAAPLDLILILILAGIAGYFLSK